MAVITYDDYRTMISCGRMSAGGNRMALEMAAMYLAICEPQEATALLMEFHEGLRNNADSQNEVDYYIGLVQDKAVKMIQKEG